MRLFRAIPAWLAASLALFAATFAVAADSGTPAANPVTGFVPDTITISSDASFTTGRPHISGKEPLIIRFCETRGKFYVGTLNYNICATPSRPLKLDGHKTTRLTMEPKIDGEWRFQGDYGVVFTPKTYWRAGTQYHVHFLPGLFPDHVKLKDQGDSYDVRTAPLYLNSKSLDYLQDPEDADKKLVTAQLSFNYPVSRASVQKTLHFSMEGQDTPLAFTPSYDADDTHVNVTVPVSGLKPSAQFMNLTIDQALKAADGSDTLTRHPPVHYALPDEEVTNEFHQRVMLPSLFDYLQISDVQAKVLKDAHYVPQQMLVFETNTKVAPADVVRYTDVRLLPKDKPIPDLPPKKDYAWSSPSEVTPEVAAALPEVKLTVKPSDDATSRLTAFDFTADAGRYLLVTIKKGMPAPGGYQLGQPYRTVLQVPALPREVKIMAQGALLSLSGEKTLSVLSLGVPRLEYKVGRVKEDDLNHLISQTRGDFSHPAFINPYDFNEQNITQIFHEERTLANADLRQPNYSSFNFAPYLDTDNGGKGLFFLTVIGKDGNGAAIPSMRKVHRRWHHRHAASSNSEEDDASASDERFILITDMGLIVKENLDGTRDVFVQSINEGGPVNGADIEVLGLNGEPVATVTTDKEGHALLPNLDTMLNEKKPVAIVARKGDDLSFIPYGRYDRELNYSKFDVDGLKSHEGMQAYIFSDRGIYRPGETAHIGLIVKSSDWSKNEVGLPLILEITNPRGQVVSKQTLQLTSEGLMAADFTPSDTAATGVYNATLYEGRDSGEKGIELGNVTVRVEEFQPDRMKMTSLFTQHAKPVAALAWVKPGDLSADITLMQLYGAPAVKRRVTGKITLSPGSFGFETYKDYSFAASNSVEKSFDETLPETVTDAEGKAQFPIDLSKYKDSTFRLTFFGEGFEPDSGRSVKTAKTLLVSPLDYVLGTKPDGSLDYISPDTKRSISLIAVAPSLAKIEVPGVTAQLLRLKNIQSLTKDNSGNYSYQTTVVETPLKTETLTISAQGTDYALPTHTPGSYAVVYKNAKGVQLARVEFTVVGEGNATGDFTRDATMNVTLDKPAYAAGDDITLHIESPYTGTGLITIETDHVLAWHWFTTEKTSSVQTIHIPDGFEGKGFVNVQFARDLHSKEIFMSPLSFAVVPFTANITARDQQVTLSVPKEAKPGDIVKIQYHTKQPGKIILYAVDEGILLYGHYQNPNPLEYFMMKRALEVKTTQIMDLLLPEYSILKEMSETGGDGFANDGKNLNPFKRKTQPPVAFWSGILDSDTDDHNWLFTVPPYFNGGVRILAVGVSDSAMGMAKASMNIHGPLIVTPNLPLFAAPGDMFTATATIANDVKGSGKDAKVKLTLTQSEQLTLLDPATQELAIPEGGELSLPIHLKATDALGSGSLQLMASLDGHNFTIAQTLSVRPPLPAMTTLASGFSPKTSLTVPQKRVLYSQLADMHAAVSSLPVALIGGLRDYLATYPYGCTEQMTSQNFPNVTLYDNGELIKAFGWKPEQMEKAIRMSFDQLRERQGESGGWGMWNYYSAPHGFITAYVMDFLLQAKEKNLPIPEDVFDTGLRYLKQSANQAPTSLEDAREKAYAIYILTRSGELTADYLPHLIDYLDANHKDVWHDDLVAVYLAATYQQMQMQKEADALLDAFHLAAPVAYTTGWHDYAFYDSLTKYSQYVYLIARHFPKRLAAMDKSVIYRVANFVGEGTYDTLSSSYAVMAIDAYVTASKGSLADVMIHATGVSGKDVALTVLGERIKTAQVSGDPVTAFSFSSSTPGFFYQIAASGYDKLLPKKPLEEGLELTRTYTAPDGKPATSVKLGDDVDVTLTLRSGSNDTIPNVAIVDLLPGGFELEPERKPAQTGSGNDATAQASSSDAATPWTPESVDRREDRIVLYGEFSSTVETYHYRIKATTRGRFVVPPTYAESMYDSTLKVRGVAGAIEVK
jgi:uncharacterized protein YfaS (alpha-2-macroglobulin family)